MHSIIPVYIKPHLVPFLFKELKFEVVLYEGKKIKAARVDNYTHFGRIIRLLLEKSDVKPKCDKVAQNFFLVQNQGRTSPFMRDDFGYADGRSSFLFLPKSGEQIINDYLEQKFETAFMFFIYSRHQSKNADPLNDIIIEFLDCYNLEDFDFDISAVRRDYYRKLKAGYFESRVSFNRLTGKVE